MRTRNSTYLRLTPKLLSATVDSSTPVCICKARRPSARVLTGRKQAAAAAAVALDTSPTHPKVKWWTVTTRQTGDCSERPGARSLVSAARILGFTETRRPWSIS